MIGVIYNVYQEFPEGADIVFQFFVENDNLKEITNESYFVPLLLNHFKEKLKISKSESIFYLDKETNGKRRVFEILGLKDTDENIRHNNFYLILEPSVKLSHGSKEYYIRLNNDDVEDYVNNLVLE